MDKHRGKSKEPQRRPIATHCAVGPNQVWMWDITWLEGPVRGLYYYLYVILDLFSRKIVAWDIWPNESAENAAVLVHRAMLSERLIHTTKPLILHSDNGSPMKGATLLEALYRLGITPSRGRPGVSNDNAYIESAFRTCKYRPGYPDSGFLDLSHARMWVLDFVKWYNHQHCHSGIQFLTPEQCHTGKSEKILNNRRLLYEQARAKHPERWTQGIRKWQLLKIVWLNLVNKKMEMGGRGDDLKNAS